MKIIRPEKKENKKGRRTSTVITISHGQDLSELSALQSRHLERTFAQTTGGAFLTRGAPLTEGAGFVTTCNAMLTRKAGLNEPKSQ